MRGKLIVDLVILAAGLGSRFGGLKQIEPVDEKDNFIIDYSVYDAIKAGFDRIVFIIKEEIREELENTIGKRISPYVEVAYAYQSPKDLPEGCFVPEDRTKPLGTSHAIYCARNVIKGNFAIINADDFYGADAFIQAASYLKSLNKDAKAQHANVAYFAKNTLSRKGSVKRGVLNFDNNHRLTKVTESSVEWRGNDIWAAPLGTKDFKKVDHETLVSMNLFVYTKDILEVFKEGLPKFFYKGREDADSAEYLTTDVMTELLEQKKAVCKVLMTNAVWHGVTYRDDLAEVVSSLKELVDKGEYPADRF